MFKGISIHIGVNSVDQTHYRNSEFGELNSCIKDAEEMEKIAEFKGFEKRTILRNAKVAQVKNKIREASGELESGGICLITFSGHGAQTTGDENSDEQDRKRKDETWCLQDRQMLDDEFLELWANFKENRRVLVISDSCHSGTIIDFFKFLMANESNLLANVINNNRFSLLERGFDFSVFENQILFEHGLDFIDFKKDSLEKNLAILKKTKLAKKLNSVFSKSFKPNLFARKVKTLPRALIRQINLDNQKVYEEARFEAKENLKEILRTSNVENVNDLKKASIMLISACQDWQTTHDGPSENDNSVFTKALIDVWDNGNFAGNYVKFHEAIANNLKTTGRIPNRYVTGNPNADFELQKPFTMEL